MKKIGCLIILALSFSTVISMGFRRALILFDPHAVELPINQDFALMTALLNGIVSKAAPIIISPSLWNNFMVRKYRFSKLSAPPPIELDQIIDFVKDLFVVYGKFVMGASYDPNDIRGFTRKLAELYRAYFDYYTRFANTIATMNVNTATFFDPTITDIQRKALFNAFSAAGLNAPFQLVPLSDIKFRKDLFFDFTCYMTPFNASEWIVKQQKDIAGKVMFYILFPKGYLNELMNKEASLELINRYIKTGQHTKGWDAETTFKRYHTRGKIIVQNGFLTKRELLTGLKLDMFDDASFVINDVHRSVPAASLEDYNFINIFVTRNDLDIINIGSEAEAERMRAEENEKLLTQWIIAAYGHGSPDINGIIVGLNRKEFFNFLTFLNYMIFTRFLFYDTCYGGGVHARFEWIKDIGVLPSQPIINKVIYNFNYTLVSGALSDAVTTIPGMGAHMPPFLTELEVIEELEKADGNKIRVKTLLFFNQRLFFEGMENFFAGKPITVVARKTRKEILPPKQETLASLINNIHYYIAPKGFAFVGNIPLIRFPYSEWFIVPEVEKRVVRLTSVKVRSAYAKALVSNKPPLIVFNDPSVVLVWPLNIPLIIRINYNAPTFISMVGGDTVHTIKELQMPTLGAQQFFGAMFKVIGMDYEKIFIFDKITLKLNIPSILQSGLLTLNDCVIGFNGKNIFYNQVKPLNFIYFTVQGNHYITSWDPASIFQYESLTPLFKKLNMSSSQDVAIVRKIMERRPKPPTIEGLEGVEKKSLMGYDLVTLARFIAQRESKNLLGSYATLKSNPQALETWKKNLSAKEQKIVESFQEAERTVSIEFKLQRLVQILEQMKNTIKTK